MWPERGDHGPHVHRVCCIGVMGWLQQLSRAKARGLGQKKPQPITIYLFSNFFSDLNFQKIIQTSKIYRNA
jgi:hypothetical protein